MHQFTGIGGTAGNGATVWGVDGAARGEQVVRGCPVGWVVTTGVDRPILGNTAGNFFCRRGASREIRCEIALAVPGEAR